MSDETEARLQAYSLEHAEEITFEGCCYRIVSPETCDDVAATLKAQDTELARLRAEREALLAALKHIAAIAHSGGAAGLDGFDAMCAVRRLTLKYWDSKQTEDEERLAAVDAVRASDCR